MNKETWFIEEMRKNCGDDAVPLALGLRDAFEGQGLAARFGEGETIPTIQLGTMCDGEFVKLVVLWADGPGRVEVATGQLYESEVPSFTTKKAVKEYRDRLDELGLLSDAEIIPSFDITELRDNDGLLHDLVRCVVWARDRIAGSC